RDGRVLEDGHVGLDEMGIPELIDLLVAVRPRRGSGELSRPEDAGEEAVTGPLPIVGDVGVVEVVAIGVVVAAAGERGAVEDRDGVAGLEDAGAADSPASLQPGRAREVVAAAEGEAIGNVPWRRSIELVRVERRRVDAGVVLRRGAGVRGIEVRTLEPSPEVEGDPLVVSYPTISGIGH